MSQPSPPADLLGTELEHLRKAWFWLLVVGALLILVGLVAMGHAFMATVASVIFLGTLSLIGGGVEFVNAFRVRGWRGFWMHVLCGILYLVFGFLLVQQPLEAAAAFTLVMAAAFLIGGLFRILIALVERFQGWGWVLLNGVVTLALGIMIWRRWPYDTYWVIGLFVGIDMVFAGWSWVITALTVRGMTRGIQ
jgi:uncharacterized membrane protein HdeD (DUF308 family)